MEKKTLEEHKEYLRECVKLSLWVIADWKNKNPQEDIIWTMDARTALVNHTILNPATLYDFPTYEGSKWPELKKELRAIYEENNDPNNFEEKGFKLLEPYIYGRAEEDLEGINGPDPFCQYKDSWARYDLTSKDEYLEIHMANSIYPKSFLADEDYFFSRLKKVVLDAEAHGFKGLKTQSWLNELPSWKSKMPKEWNDSITNRRFDIEWHLGFWGQFLTSNQCFNKKLGDKFRETGVVPYPMSSAQCSIEGFNKHLGIA
ncbi:MAG: hypothetical protein JXR64_05740 [Spirochaetales bacterium]|nr:hypothetical protein [Spirochaetales bacterium]